VPVPDRPSEASDLALGFNAMAERLEDERRDSTRRALGAQEGERLRIARELHDEVGQQLTGLVLQLKSARRRAGGDLEPALAEMQALARRSLDEVRRVARELRPRRSTTSACRAPWPPSRAGSASRRGCASSSSCSRCCRRSAPRRSSSSIGSRRRR
jgi:Histidine kinase